jgi:hypothetical protein
MDEKASANGYESSSDYNFPTYEWRWWHNVLGLAIILAIGFLIL